MAQQGQGLRGGGGTGAQLDYQNSSVKVCLNSSTIRVRAYILRPSSLAILGRRSTNSLAASGMIKIISRS